MTPDLDLREIDQDLLASRIAELESSQDLGSEYKSLCWARTFIYLEAEGFLTLDDDGAYWPTSKGWEA